MADSVSGIQIISYEGRQVCSLKSPGLVADSLSHQTVAVCGDTVAIKDKKDEKRNSIVSYFDH